MGNGYCYNLSKKNDLQNAHRITSSWRITAEGSRAI